jgi:hypothetical protein
VAGGCEWPETGFRLITRLSARMDPTACGCNGLDYSQAVTVTGPFRSIGRLRWLRNPSFEVP